MITINNPTEHSRYRHFYYKDSEGSNWKYRICRDLGAELERLYNESYTGRKCFIVSAYRPEDSEEINNCNADKLSENIYSSGLGQIRIMSDNIITAFFVPQPENFSDEEFFRIAENLDGKEITFSGEDVMEYFSGLNGGKIPEWLAIKNPNSVPQACLMHNRKENLLFRVKK